MEIKISFDETGKFSIEKTDGMATFTAIGMLELAKKVMFEDTNRPKVVDEIEEGEQITLEELEKVE